MKDLTGEIKEFAQECGADLVGIAPAHAFEGERIKPTDLLPGAKSVVVIARKILDGACDLPLENEQRHEAFHRMFPTSIQLSGLDINLIGYRVAVFIERKGHQAVMVRAYYGAPMDEERRGMFGDFNMMRAGYEAGLGTIGDNLLLITPKFGPRVWILPIMTTAELEPDGRIKEDLCSHCNLCIENCPTGFLGEPIKDTRDFIRRATKCIAHNEPGGLPGVIRFLETKIIGKSEEEQRAAIRTPEFWNLWYFLLYGGLSYECGKCLRICPVGQEDR